VEQCRHMNFSANVAVARLENAGKFNAEIRINCADCGVSMQFLGLVPGCNLNGANVSMDGQEARIAISPSDVTPNPLMRMMGEKLN
jgi:hypothetical protein